MAKKLPELSKTEWLLMKICWTQGKSTARQIYEEALKKKDWGYQTVKTMLDRIVNKGYLRREKLGPLCLYQPGVPRSEVVKKAVQTFADTVLDNTFAPLFVHLAKGRKLTDEEIASLKKLVEEYKDEDANEHSK
jgi:BlaI family penicillinase repressor